MWASKCILVAVTDAEPCFKAAFLHQCKPEALQALCPCQSCFPGSLVLMAGLMHFHTALSKASLFFRCAKVLKEACCTSRCWRRGLFCRNTNAIIHAPFKVTVEARNLFVASWQALPVDCVQSDSPSVSAVVLDSVLQQAG